jgi:competence protein ComEC
MAEDDTEHPAGTLRRAAGAAVLPARWTVPAAWPRPALAPWLARAVATEVEQRRLFPWLAVAFGAGILLFFQADAPALWAPAAGCALCAALAIRVRASLRALAAAAAGAALFAGFAAAILRTRAVEAPVLSGIVIAPLSGFIEEVEERPAGARLTLRLTALDGVPAETRPRRVRVTVRDRAGLAPGQHIAAKARLLPPPPPAWPGGYDFARDAFYRGIGAVGSVLGPVARSEPAVAPGWRLRVAAAVDAARNALTTRIAQAIGGQPGAVAAALVTGKRGLIEEPTNDLLRAAGIYHIVSISGLHMVLAAGTVFWLARALLALAPAVALLWPVKKIAAAVAMAGAVAYCVFSGSEVATERSLVMTLVMLGAILVDRPALSIRNLTLAALIVLAREPESLIGPSFQMSFGAVAALTALAPFLHPAIGEGAPRSVAERAVRALGRSALGLVLMTLVASLATAPFSAFHFQTLNPFGLVGNALALPLVSLAVMPAAVIGVIAYPFGLDAFVWQLMGAAVAQVLDVSAFVSAFAGSTVVVPAPGRLAFGLLVAALLIATLPASSLRWLAVVPAGAGLALAAAPLRFDALVDREGAGAAIRGPAGRLVLVGRPSGFVVEQWLRADGDGRSADDATLRRDARCDRLGCVVTMPDGRSVAYVQDVAAFEEDCRRAAVVVTRLAAPACGASLVLDRDALKERGATALRFDGDAVILRSTAPGRHREERRPLRGAGAPQTHDRPRPARPTIDLPDAEDLSSGEPG